MTKIERYLELVELRRKIRDSLFQINLPTDAIRRYAGTGGWEGLPEWPEVVAWLKNADGEIGRAVRDLLLQHVEKLVKRAAEDAEREAESVFSTLHGEGKWASPKGADR